MWVPFIVYGVFGDEFITGSVERGQIDSFWKGSSHLALLVVGEINIEHINIYIYFM